MNSNSKIQKLIATSLAGIGLAMGVAVIVLSKLKELDTKTMQDLLGMGVACVSLSVLMKNEK